MNDLKKWFFGFWLSNYKVSFLIFFLLVITGIFSAYTIPKESSPDIKFWIISISTAFPWVSPTDIDNLITEKIENEIKNVDGIKKVTSSSSVWFSSVTVELFNGVDVRNALTDIKDSVDKVSLPEDANDPLVQEISTMNELMFQALLYGDKEQFDDFTLTTLAKKIQDALEWKKWIVSIDVGWSWVDMMLWAESSGDAEYEIKVLISKEKMELLWFSISEIASKVRAFNKNMPIGNYTIGDLNYDFRFDGEFTTLSDLENLVIRDTWGSQIVLKDIAEFKKEYPTKNIKSLWFYGKAWFNYISLSFNKKTGENIFKISNNAKKELTNLLASNPEFKWLDVKYTNDMSDAISKDYESLWTNARQTFLLIFFITLMFVWIRESMIISILLPVSFLITFTILNSLWLSMNFLTNFSLVLTLWIAIDTVTVIIEWASKLQKLWYDRETAVLLAVKEFKAPIISSTATTLAAFIPMIFLPGIIGKFLSYIPITVFSVVIVALILSLTLAIPFFAKFAKKSNTYSIDSWYESRISPDEKKILQQERMWKKKISIHAEWERFSLLYKIDFFYYKLLKKFISSKLLRLSSIFVPIFLLILTFIFLAPRIGFILFPSTDEWIITMSIEAKTWMNKEALTEYIPQVETFIKKYEELKVFYINLSWNKINVSVELTDAKQRQKDNKRDVFTIEKLITDDFKYFETKGLKVSVETLKWGPPSWSAVWIKLVVLDNTMLPILRNVAKEFESYVKTISGTKNVTLSSSDNPGQFVFHFDSKKISFLGLTPSDLLTEVYFYINGVKTWTIKSEYEDNDIVIKVADFDEYLTPDQVLNLVISTRIWKIRVGDVADYVFEPSLSSISREDGNILISINGDLEKWVVPTSVQPKISEFAKKYNFPEGVSYIEWWENAENADLIISTIQAFFIALFLIFSILVLQFWSYSQSLIILYTVVLGLLWVNIGLFVTGNPYSMPFAIGFIALTWVVVSNAIILIDVMNSNVHKLIEHWEKDISEHDFVESLLISWRSRLQPILLTTLTTVIWIIPLAMTDAFWAWLWYTIVYWLSLSTILTLFITPSIYYSLYKKRYVKE